ncbi:MAG: hypothetical protein IMX04_09535 [Candidatus Carbobacillus altaicus]|nr:hypothetical protein [Candidatus Carbobacillus altaicus]
MQGKKRCGSATYLLRTVRLAHFTLLLTVAVLFFTGCQMGGREGAQGLERTMRAEDALGRVKQTLDQSSFIYDGEVFWQDAGSSSTPAALVHGSAGPNRHLYVRLSVGQDAVTADDMDFYATPEAVYIRFADDVAWQKADVPMEIVQGELQNWDPRAHLGRLFRLAESIRYVGPRSSDGLTVEAVLSPQAMAQELEQDIQNRTHVAGQMMPPADIPPKTGNGNDTFPESVRWAPDRHHPDRASKESGSSGPFDAQIMRQLSSGRKVDDRLSETPPGTVPSSSTPALSGTYTVLFNAKTFEPIWIDYRERAVYDDEGQRYDDTTRYRFTFRQFGSFEGPSDTLGIEQAP